jgi:aldose 1-epimerase
MRTVLWMLLLTGFHLAVVAGSSAKESAGVHKSAFGKLQDGREAHLYTLTNKSGMQVAISDFGGTVVSIRVPDRFGKMGDVVLGYDSVEGYEHGTASLGATTGRYANRIAGGKFTLDGAVTQLTKNNGENHLHGNFNKVLWEVVSSSGGSAPSLHLHYLSKESDEGYPGNLAVEVVFSVTHADELKIEYSATTDKKTVLNLTNHSYFDLSESVGSVLGYELTVNGSKVTPTDKGQIPTGDLRSVAGTPFDFRKATVIGARIDQDDEQLKFGSGYDHNWVLDDVKKGKPTLAATLYDPSSGRVIETFTTEPGLQVYTGNFLDEKKGKGGQAYQRRFAVCLETQHFPDSPNHPEFPTTTLAPGEKFNSTTIYKFSVRKVSTY